MSHATAPHSLSVGVIVRHCEHLPKTPPALYRVVEMDIDNPAFVTIEDRHGKTLVRHHSKLSRDMAFYPTAPPPSDELLEALAVLLCAQFYPDAALTAVRADALHWAHIMVGAHALAALLSSPEEAAAFLHEHVHEWPARFSPAAEVAETEAFVRTCSHLLAA